MVRNKRTAMLSVYHKDGIVDFSRSLIELGWNILASGGTARHLKENGVEVTDIADLIGGGAILGHRVVTLSREFYAGLLAADVEEDWAELEKINFPWIDLVCCDMYPLQEAIDSHDATIESVKSHTDIGGPTMLRAAAKGNRLVICDPTDRDRVITMLKAHQNVEAGNLDSLRLMLAAKAELVVAKYVSASGHFLEEQLSPEGHWYLHVE